MPTPRERARPGTVCRLVWIPPVRRAEPRETVSAGTRAGASTDRHHEWANKVAGTGVAGQISGSAK